jgi:hypothetical protein
MVIKIRNLIKTRSPCLYLSFSYKGNMVFGLFFVYVKSQVPSPPIVITAVFTEQILDTSIKFYYVDNFIIYFSKYK